MFELATCALKFVIVDGNTFPDFHFILILVFDFLGLADHGHRTDGGFDCVMLLRELYWECSVHGADLRRGPHLTAVSRGF